ncbi:isocitrate lyase/phosphoenolpyruvate mutase family protein [Maricaulis sp.]|uniref:isocitrate lyase/PEP mutase family protein n=3 Tax=Maricaulis sp. TaxID=1486257 RepID=UPI003298D3E8
MTQGDLARRFAALHVKGAPLVLYNIWDAGSAAAVAKAGARALATGSASVAAAQGYKDGQALPLEALLATARRIVETTELPVTVDFEGGYAEAPASLAANTSRLIETGAVGVNFEDQIVGGDGIHPVEVQADRIRAIRKAADEAGIPLFINARTDLFLKERDADRQAALIGDAGTRAAAYAEAGASGFFVPGLGREDLIERICAASPLPVNAMMMPGMPDRERLAALGVARISHGPFPYLAMMDALKSAAAEAIGTPVPA